ncbi:single-stranded DNA-binding protein [Thermostaphylospora chromogena]|uniref:Single-stranded DNA-binding protein n=1 Tax=Thermostaphylospora chromogena TaxID=35622 RepID=A0A1H1I7L5_9ACTN|nr:single-stranded DNA-binding protein [Thermostaphylospora chromogena]SDR33326.1 single stranded DNA-binding protein (ssb) [Thermostaphylospora chromogena]
MNDIYVTLVGNVAAEPRQHTLADGSRVTSLRVATTSRYFDKKLQEWRDGDKAFFAVRCWRGLGDNVAQSVRLGQPVVIHGRLRIREFEREGERRFIPEVEATSVGHDLRWGVSSFSRPPRGAAPSVLDAETRHSLDTAIEDWAFAAGRPAAPASPATSGASSSPSASPVPLPSAAPLHPATPVTPPSTPPTAPPTRQWPVMTVPAASEPATPTPDRADDASSAVSQTPVPAGDGSGSTEQRDGVRPRRRTDRRGRTTASAAGGPSADLTGEDRAAA